MFVHREFLCERIVHGQSGICKSLLFALVKYLRYSPTTRLPPLFPLTLADNSKSLSSVACLFYTREFFLTISISHHRSQHQDHSPLSPARSYHAISQATHLLHRARQHAHQSRRVWQRLRRRPCDQLHRRTQRRSKLQHPPHLSRLHCAWPCHVCLHGWPVSV